MTWDWIFLCVTVYSSFCYMDQDNFSQYLGPLFYKIQHSFKKNNRDDVTAGVLLCYSQKKNLNEWINNEVIKWYCISKSPRKETVMNYDGWCHFITCQMGRIFSILSADTLVMSLMLSRLVPLMLCIVLPTRIRAHPKKVCNVFSYSGMAVRLCWLHVLI